MFLGNLSEKVDLEEKGLIFITCLSFVEYHDCHRLKLNLVKSIHST